MATRRVTTEYVKRGPCNREAAFYISFYFKEHKWPVVSALASVLYELPATAQQGEKRRGSHQIGAHLVQVCGPGPRPVGWTQLPSALVFASELSFTCSSIFPVQGLSTTLLDSSPQVELPNQVSLPRFLLLSCHRVLQGVR